MGGGGLGALGAPFVDVRAGGAMKFSKKTTEFSIMGGVIFSLWKYCTCLVAASPWTRHVPYGHTAHVVDQ